MSVSKIEVVLNSSQLNKTLTFHSRIKIVLGNLLCEGNRVMIWYYVVKKKFVN